MRRLCVIFNPSAGRQRSDRRIEPFRQRWQGVADFWPTEFAGHATALAQQAVQAGYAVVAAAGGDGTVHEVAAGLLATDRRDVTFAVVPIGSANDYGFSLKQQFGESELDDEAGCPVDVGRLRIGAGPDRYFVESLGIGLTGEITVESRSIPHRQGLWLYGTAAFRVLWRRQPSLRLQIAWDDAPPVDEPTRLLSVLLGQREGNFVMARDALLDDGLFDVLHAGDISPWEALRLLPRFLLSGPPRNHPRIVLRRCHHLTIESSDPLAIHADGEIISTPADDARQVDLQLLPHRLRAKVCRVESAGVQR